MEDLPSEVQYQMGKLHHLRNTSTAEGVHQHSIHSTPPHPPLSPFRRLATKTNNEYHEKSPLDTIAEVACRIRKSDSQNNFGNPINVPSIYPSRGTTSLPPPDVADPSAMHQKKTLPRNRHHFRSSSEHGQDPNMAHESPSVDVSGKSHLNHQNMQSSVTFLQQSHDEIMSKVDRFGYSLQSINNFISNHAIECERILKTRLDHYGDVILPHVTRITADVRRFTLEIEVLKREILFLRNEQGSRLVHISNVLENHLALSSHNSSSPDKNNILCAEGSNQRDNDPFNTDGANSCQMLQSRRMACELTKSREEGRELVRNPEIQGLDECHEEAKRTSCQDRDMYIEQANCKGISKTFAITSESINTDLAAEKGLKSRQKTKETETGVLHGSGMLRFEQERDSKCNVRKRRRDNWSEDENKAFTRMVLGSLDLEEMALRRMLAKHFAPRRTHEQCSNHLRILRAQNKLPGPNLDPSVNKEKPL